MLSFVDFNNGSLFLTLGIIRLSAPLMYKYMSPVGYWMITDIRFLSDENSSNANNLYFKIVLRFLSLITNILLFYYPRY